MQILMHANSQVHVLTNVFFNNNKYILIFEQVSDFLVLKLLKKKL